MRVRSQVGRRIVVGALLAAQAVGLHGCGGTEALFFDDCSDPMAATVAELGAPDDVQSQRIDDWHFVVYTYWYVGLSRSFEWDVFKDCEVRDTRFTPRPQP